VLPARTLPTPCLPSLGLQAWKELGAPSREKARRSTSFHPSFPDGWRGKTSLQKPWQGGSRPFPMARTFCTRWPHTQIRHLKTSLEIHGRETRYICWLNYMVDLHVARLAPPALVRGCSEKEYNFHFPAVALCTSAALREHH